MPREISNAKPTVARRFGTKSHLARNGGRFNLNRHRFNIPNFQLFMSTAYHIATPDGRQLGPLELETIKAMLAAGTLSPDALLWQAGMADWAPISTIIPLESIAADMGQIPPLPNRRHTPPSPLLRNTDPRLHKPRRPENHMVKAILILIFCCLPAGIVAVIYASQVDSEYNRGDYAGALAASKKADFWCQLGLIPTLIVSLLYVVALFASM